MEMWFDDARSDPPENAAAGLRPGRALDPRPGCLRSLIEVIDGMIGDLEQERLRDVRAAGGDWRLRLLALFLRLSCPDRPVLRPAPAPTEVMDLLYDVQQHLFNLERDIGRAQGAEAVRQVRGLWREW